MRACVLILFLTFAMVPTSGHAIIPTTDVPGTLQAMTEVGHTINNVKESATQVSQYQKTMAAIGTAVKSVSEYIADQKEKLAEIMERLEQYKEQLEEYKAKAEAYKAAAEAKLSEVSEYKNKIENAYNNAGDMVSSAKEQAENALETAKNQAEDALNAAKNQAEDFIDNASSTLTDAGINVGNNAATTDDGANDLSASDLVDTPVDTPSREPIIDSTAATDTPSNSVEPEEPSASSTSSSSATKTPDSPAVQNLENNSGLSSSAKPAQQMRMVDQPNTTDSDDINQQTPSPTRASFKLSASYGIHNSYPLGFASLEFFDISKTKGNTAPGNVLVIPEGLSLYCGLDYEQAIEEGKLDECLKKVNTVNNSEVGGDITREDVSNAERDIYNGLAEYVAAAYFEAFNAYNDSITFKNNMIDPITTAEIDTVEKAWSYSQEMNRILGTRYNVLNSLWARSLGIQMYKTYAREQFKEDQQEDAQ